MELFFFSFVTTRLQKMYIKTCFYLQKRRPIFYILHAFFFFFPVSRVLSFQCEPINPRGRFPGPVLRKASDFELFFNKEKPKLCRQITLPTGLLCVDSRLFLSLGSTPFISHSCFLLTFPGALSCFVQREPRITPIFFVRHRENAKSVEGGKKNNNNSNNKPRKLGTLLIRGEVPVPSVLWTV